MSSKKSIGVGVIGFGTIGTGVVRILRENSAQLKARLGVPLRLARIADLDLKTDRGVKVPADVLTNDARALINDPNVDVVVELMGGIEPARTFHEEALRAGKAVISANKALVSGHGPKLARLAESKGLAYGFEASVAGGIPIVRTLKDALASDRNLEVYGIVNGTANYILSEMAEGTGEFVQVLSRAQHMGLAEADPTYDVDGIDSVHKLAILCALAFGKRIRTDAIHVEGIRKISGIDIAYAKEFGYSIKLLAVARPTKNGIEARVHPAMVPNTHLLSKVNGAFNAVCLRGKALGSSIYYGQGAGSMPTATAVVADILDAARSIVTETKPLPAYGQPIGNLEAARVVAMGDLSHEYYIRFQLRDAPGVLSKITAILGRAGVSIATAAQHERPSRGTVPVVLRTHRVRERSLAGALAKIAKLAECREQPVVIRVEETLGEEDS